MGPFGSLGAKGLSFASYCWGKVLLKLKGRTAVVTGAASGIGRSIARSLARRQCDIALADIDGTSLAHTAKEIAAFGVRVSQHNLNVASPEAIDAFVQHVKEEHGVRRACDTGLLAPASPS